MDRKEVEKIVTLGEALKQPINTIEFSIAISIAISNTQIDEALKILHEEFLFHPKFERTQKRLEALKIL